MTHNSLIFCQCDDADSVTKKLCKDIQFNSIMNKVNKIQL